MGSQSQTRLSDFTFTTMIKWGLSQGCKDFSISANQSVIHHTHKLKNETHMIISIDAGKASDKIQHPFTIKKKSPESRHRGRIPKIIKGHI